MRKHMTAGEKKKLVLEHYVSFVEKQDAEAVRRQLSADFLDHEMPSSTPASPKSVLEYRAMLHEAFPDPKVRIEDIVTEGDRVAVRATWTGTHCGSSPMMPISVTDRAFKFSGTVFWRIREDRIVERWVTIDRLGLQQQPTTKS